MKNDKKIKENIKKINDNAQYYLGMPNCCALSDRCVEDIISLSKKLYLFYEEQSDFVNSIYYKNLKEAALIKDIDIADEKIINIIKLNQNSISNWTINNYISAIEGA